MPGAVDRRLGPRIRIRMTAVVKPPRHRRPTVLQVLNLAEGGALCRCRVPFRLGATFPARFVVDGLGTPSRPSGFRAYCRVVWTAARSGPARPVQEVGLAFTEMSQTDRERLGVLLAEIAAA